GERLRQFEVGRLLQVEHDAFLAAIVQREQRAFAVLERADMAIVVARRGLELDDIGAKVGEQRRAIRPGENARQVEDLDARKRSVHAFRSGASATSRLRIAARVTRSAAAFSSS